MRIFVLALLLVTFLVAEPTPAVIDAAASSAKAARSKSNPKVREAAENFVASSDLRALAEQLAVSRNAREYAAVESYARKNADTPQGALAWFAIGYFRMADGDTEAAIVALRNARPQAGELSDQVEYHLAEAYARTARFADVARLLDGFATRYPESIQRTEAALLLADAYILANKPTEAVKLLEEHREPFSPRVEFALGKAYREQGSRTKAIATLQHLYFTAPLSSEADQAETVLTAMGGEAMPTKAPAELHLQRADLLLKGKRYSAAAAEFQQLLRTPGLKGRTDLQVKLGATAYHRDRNTEAKRILFGITASGETEAERLYYLAELARRAKDEQALADAVGQLREKFATSEFLQKALMAGGNMYFLQNDFDTASRFYGEMVVRFPKAEQSPLAHWRTAWLSYRQRDIGKAKQLFEEQIRRYPESEYVSGALYWRARIAEDQNDAARARAFYQRLVDRYRFYYYAVLARERLKELGAAGESVDDELLSYVPDGRKGLGMSSVQVPAENLRAQRILLLQNAGLDDLAIEELQALWDDSRTPWAIAEISRIHQTRGKIHQSLRFMKRNVPGYFAMEVEDLPREYWEALFPRVHWTDLKKYSLENELDPFLVASLIRQESEFNAGATSKARAMGLMQLLPETGRQVARSLNVKRFNRSQLYVPDLNLRLGTKYFRDMLDRFDNRVEYALAAYNAGPHRVDKWRAEGEFRDMPEFVESIPFTETREYVQAIVRNSVVYKQLYGTP